MPKKPSIKMQFNYRTLKITRTLPELVVMTS